LAKAKAYGLVQDVYLFGTPVIIKQKECLRAQSIVAGRFVNGYKSNDWILGYLFRATSTGIGRVAGLRPIENCGDIENVDCTEIVGGHLMYRDAIPKLMKEVGFLVVSEEFTEIEDPDPDKHRERQIALYNEIEEAKKLVAQEEEEAIRTGKKVKRRARKTGFLGLWGKEIESKPADFVEAGKNGEEKKTEEVAKEPVANPSSEPREYDPHQEKGFYKKGEKTELALTKPVLTKSKEDDNVLFDVEKMREELASNGITITSLESTLPPLVLSPPPITPPPSSIPRALTTPTLAPIQRKNSPSLPAIVQNNVPARDIDQTWAKPLDVMPQRKLGKMVVETKKPRTEPTKSTWTEPSKNAWDNAGEITMSFEPDSPKIPRKSALNDPYLFEIDTLGERPGISSSVLNIPVEKNVWDDDDYGSGGNITMSFE
jgi:hypothetical protein